MAMKFTFPFLNLAKIHIFIPKFGQNSHFSHSAYGGGGTGLGNIPKKNNFFDAFPNVPPVEVVFFQRFASPSPPPVSHTGSMSTGHCVGLLVSLFTFCDVVRLPAVSIGSSSTLCWPSHLCRPPPLQVPGWPNGPSTPQCAHCDRITASHARPAMQSRSQVCR